MKQKLNEIKCWEMKLKEKFSKKRIEDKVKWNQNNEYQIQRNRIESNIRDKIEKERVQNKIKQLAIQIIRAKLEEKIKSKDKIQVLQNEDKEKRERKKKKGQPQL